MGFYQLFLVINCVVVMYLTYTNLNGKPPVRAGWALLMGIIGFAIPLFSWIILAFILIVKVATKKQENPA